MPEIIWLPTGGSGFFKIPNWAARALMECSPSAIKLYVMLASLQKQHEDGHVYSFASTAKLMEWCHLSRPSVVRGIDELTEKGLLQLRRAGTRGRAAEYFVVQKRRNARKSARKPKFDGGINKVSPVIP